MIGNRNVPYVSPEVFLRLFGDFEAGLRQMMRVGPERALTLVAADAASKHASLRNHRDTIRDLTTLRNVIAHGNDRVGRALPTRETADELAHLVSILRLLNDPATKLLKGPPRLFRANDPLNDVLTFMAQNDFSQVVVRDDSGALNLLTAIDISSWLAKRVAARDTLMDLNDHRLGELITFEASTITRKFGLMARNVSIADVEDKFTSAVQRDYDNLFCALITQSGRASENILGIITAWDLFHVGKG